MTLGWRKAPPSPCRGGAGWGHFGLFPPRQRRTVQADLDGFKRLNEKGRPANGWRRCLNLKARRAFRRDWTDGPMRSCGREAEGGGLLNRCRVVKPYRGFESLRLRQNSFPGCLTASPKNFKNPIKSGILCTVPSQDVSQHPKPLGVHLGVHFENRSADIPPNASDRRGLQRRPPPG